MPILSKDTDVDIGTPEQRQGTVNRTINTEDTGPTLPRAPPKPSVSPALATQNGPIKLTKFESYVHAKKESHTNSFKADFAVSWYPWRLKRYHVYVNAWFGINTILHCTVKVYK